MKTPTLILTVLFSAALFMPRAWADEVAAGADESEAVVEELVKEGVTGADQALKLQEKLRAHVRAQKGEQGVCADEEKAQCLQRLRKQVRESYRIAKQKGAVKAPEDALRVAAAVMLMAGGEEGAMEQAGELVQFQLKKGHGLKEIVETAEAMHMLQNQNRWRKQAMELSRQCLEDGSCSPQQLRVALRVMQQASGHAEIDARKARNVLQITLREEAKHAAKGETALSGEALRTKLQTRLRLRAHGDDEFARDGGEQKRHRYRSAINGEDRRGGDFGGPDSKGPASTGPINGGGPK